MMVEIREYRGIYTTESQVSFDTPLPSPPSLCKPSTSPLLLYCDPGWLCLGPVTYHSAWVSTLQQLQNHLVLGWQFPSRYIYIYIYIWSRGGVCRKIWFSCVDRRRLYLTPSARTEERRLITIDKSRLTRILISVFCGGYSLYPATCLSQQLEEETFLSI